MPTVAGLVGLSLTVAGCGPAAQPKAILSEAQYTTFAQSFAVVELCSATQRLTPEDTVGLRQTINQNLSKYQYDQVAIVRTSQDLFNSYMAGDADPANKPAIDQKCAGWSRGAATNRAQIAQNNAAQLQQAQLAAARAQQRAASSYDFQPQPFYMPQIPNYQMPQVQPLQLSGGGATFFSCRQLSSYVTTCR